MIIDTFPFNKDFRALEIRLSEMGELADLIVISESTVTHSGDRKPLHLSENMDALGKFREKVQVLISRENKWISNPRIREMIQRQEITKFLEKIVRKDDYVIHSDCDEIPRKKTVESLVNSKIKGSFLLQLDNYANALNLSDGKWDRLRVVSGDYFESIQKMRQDIFLQKLFGSRSKDWAIIRVPDFWTERKYLWRAPQLVRRPEMSLILEGGWHFNNLLYDHEVIEKIENSCHVEWATEEVKAKAMKNFREGRDIYLGKEFERVNIDDSYPDEIRLNMDKWSGFIR